MFDQKPGVRHWLTRRAIVDMRHDAMFAPSGRGRGVTRSIDDIRALIAIRLEMEDGVAPVGNVLPLSPRDPEGQPRVLVCRTSAGTLVFCRDDVPESPRQQILQLEDRAYPEDMMRQILVDNGLGGGVLRVRWYTMESGSRGLAYPDVEMTPRGFVIIINGQEVSRAWTTQESTRAIEVEVETDATYRGRGYARQVVAAWADWALTTGKVAFYSHLLSNDASAGVARSLGLTHLSDEVEYL